MVKKIFLCLGMIVSILAMAGTVCLGFYAKQRGIVYLKTGGDPKETVRLFYDAVLAQDYDTAYSYLRDYRTLGFAQEDSGLSENLPAACWEMFRNALLDSYSYELVGEPVVQGLNAEQKVKFICFYPDLFCQEINERFYRMLEGRVQSLPKHEMFDEDGNYRVEMLEKFYEEVLRETMEDSGQYLRTTEYTVELSYQNKEWKILVNDKMTEGFIGR